MVLSSFAMGRIKRTAHFGLIFADPDRALGTMPASGDRHIELRLRNQTGRSIHSFTLRYDGEQWRIGTLVAPTALVLRYSTDGVNFVDIGPGFNFTSPRVAIPPLLENIAVNGNEPNNRVAGIGGLYTPAALVPNGAIIYLRWFDADEPGADPGLAIDNFSFSVTTPGGPSLALRDNSDHAPDSWAGVQAARFSPRIDELLDPGSLTAGYRFGCVAGKPGESDGQPGDERLALFSPPQSCR